MGVQEQAPTAQTRFTASTSTPLELLPKRWFCAGLESSGRTFKLEAESSTNFLEIANRSVITWVDYITDDPARDLPMVAARWGLVKPS